MNRQQLGRYLRNGIVIVALGAALAACSGGNIASVTTPPVLVPAEDFFGTGFGVKYRAAANSEPVVPQASDIIAVSLTTEPKAI